MPAALLEEVEIDFCDRCGGTWLDGGELEVLATLRGRAVNVVALDLPPARPAQRDPFCPRCDRPLAPARAGAVSVDVCPRGHGLFFDRGEMEALELVERLL